MEFSVDELFIIKTSCELALKLSEKRLNEDLSPELKVAYIVTSKKLKNIIDKIHSAIKE